MGMENYMSPVIRNVWERCELPQAGTPEQLWLYIFTVLQSLRTLAAADTVASSVDQFAKAILRRKAEAAGIDLAKVEIGYDDPVLLSLRQLEIVVGVMGDLEAKLLYAGEAQRFITSDNPVFRYNFYCEGTRNRGILGWAQRGFMLFVPLSPRVVLILFDAGVYKVGSRHTSVVSKLSDQDVSTINLFQLVNASSNVYFDDWGLLGRIQELDRRAAAFRGQKGARVVEYLAESDVNRALLHSFEQMPNLKLNLSFLSVRRDARRVNLHERARTLRNARHPGLGFGDPPPSGGPERFVRPSHHPILKRRVSKQDMNSEEGYTE